MHPMMAKLDLVNERTKHKFVLEGKVDVIGSVADVVFVLAGKRALEKYGRVNWQNHYLMIYFSEPSHNLNEDSGVGLLP